MTAPKQPKPLRPVASARRDPSRRAHFKFDQSVARAQVRMEQFHRALFGPAGRALGPSTSALGALIGLEAVVVEADLAPAFEALGARIQLREHERINWISDAKTDARLLSAVTTGLCLSMQTWPGFELARAQLESFLARQKLYLPRPSESCITQLLNDAQQWCQMNLSPVLFGHVTHKARLTPVPVTTFVRQITRRALSRPASTDDAASSTAETLNSEGFEAAMLGRQEGLDAGNFIEELLDALRPPASGSEQKKRKVVKSKIAQLHASLRYADEAGALLFVYSVQLIYRGTATKENLDSATPYAYVQSIARDVHAAFEDTHISDLSEEQHLQIWTALAAKDPANAPRMTALRGFHRFLRAWWNAPALPGSLFDKQGEAVVAANVVWPREFARILRWLKHNNKPRAHKQALVALAMAGGSIARIEELLSVRCMNVHDEGDHFMFELAGHEKTPEGRRRAYVRSKPLVRIIRAWDERRAAEKAKPGDFFFGDPNDASRIADRGRTYYLMNLLLKAATGDDDISVHTLRHTNASYELKEELENPVDKEVNALDQTGTDAGHVGGHVTAKFYGHQFELALRKQLDLAILPKIRAVDLTALSPTGVLYDNVRQCLSRTARASSNKADSVKRTELIREINKILARPPAGEHVQPWTSSYPTYIPASPLREPGARSISFAQVLGAIVDTGQGLSRDTVCLRQDLSQGALHAALEHVGRFADRHGARQFDQRDFVDLGQKALVDASGLLLGFKPAFRQASEQPHLATLRKGVAHVDKELLDHACGYWTRAFAHGELPLFNVEALHRFAQFLKSCEVPNSLVGLRWCCADPTSPALPTAVVQISDIFEGAFGTAIKTIQLKPRSGRPLAWLILATASNLREKKGRGACMASFHSLMLAACAWLSIPKETPDAK